MCLTAALPEGKPRHHSRLPQVQLVTHLEKLPPPFPVFSLPHFRSGSGLEKHSLAQLPPVRSPPPKIESLSLLLGTWQHTV